MTSVAALRRMGATAGLVFTGALTLVGPMVPVVHADNAPTDCILPLSSESAMGAIDFDDSIRPVGTVRALLLFVDFPDVPATKPADQLYETNFAGADDWLATSSYGKLNLEITPIRHWVRMPKPTTAYHFPSGSVEDEDEIPYIADALKAVDGEVNFLSYRIVYIIASKEQKLVVRADARTFDTEDGIPLDGTLVRGVVAMGAEDWEDGASTIDHETGHVFGLPDYYTDTPGSVYAAAGDWSIMSSSYDYLDNFGWDKWRLGWLANSQIACLNGETDDDYTLTPLAADDGGLKDVVLRTGLNTAIVAEYRTAEGNDANACSEGVLIYSVNATTETDPVQVSDANPDSLDGEDGCDADKADAPYVADGTFADESSGIQIDVTSVGDGEASIHVTRTTTYKAPVRRSRSMTISAVRNSTGTTTISGVLTASGHFKACEASRRVSLQRRVGTSWVTVRTANTNSVAAWKYTFRAKPGVYRLLALDRLTTAYDCLPTFSKAITVK